MSGPAREHSGPSLQVHVVFGAEVHRQPVLLVPIVEQIARRERIEPLRSVGRRPGSGFRVTKPRAQVGRGFGKVSYVDFGSDVDGAAVEARRRALAHRLPRFSVIESPSFPSLSERWGCVRSVDVFGPDFSTPGFATFAIGGTGLLEPWPAEFGDAVLDEVAELVQLGDAVVGRGDLFLDVLELDADRGAQPGAGGWLLWLTGDQVAALGGRDDVLGRLPVSVTRSVRTSRGEGLLVTTGAHPLDVTEPVRHRTGAVLAPLLAERPPLDP